MSASAQDDSWSDTEWDDDWGKAETQWQQSGFIELAYGHRLESDVLFEEQQTLSDLRWHQEFDYQHDAFYFSWAHDVWYDGVLTQWQLDLRELNIQFSVFDNTDFKIGRQITTWGTGDLLFINDLFPKDWVSFFAGRDDNYLKAPADTIRITSYLKPINLDLVITPTAEPSRFINGERFSLFSPFLGTQIGGKEVVNPKNSTHTEIALRLFKNIKGHQLAFYGYQGTEKSPTAIDDNNDAFFPKKRVLGASYQAAVSQGIFNVEVGYHHSKQDNNGDNPLVPNSQWRALLGYNKELIKKLNWGLQLYLEHTQDHTALINHSLNPQFEPVQNRHVITNRLTYQALQDKLSWSLFVFYSPSDEDSYWRPSVNYRYNDNLSYSLGASIFKGQKAHTFFGQFEDASNVYFRLRYTY